MEIQHTCTVGTVTQHLIPKSPETPLWNGQSQWQSSNASQLFVSLLSIVREFSTIAKLWIRIPTRIQHNTNINSRMILILTIVDTLFTRKLQCELKRGICCTKGTLLFSGTLNICLALQSFFSFIILYTNSKPRQKSSWGRLPIYLSLSLPLSSPPS